MSEKTPIATPVEATIVPTEETPKLSTGQRIKAFFSTRKGKAVAVTALLLTAGAAGAAIANRESGTSSEDAGFDHDGNGNPLDVPDFTSET